jgi:FKBP-type peptidyl-prolyl cis-trans isomerase FkpA/FKBP-type peptidyl-prolyl cis-trans isomerase FklB
MRLRLGRIGLIGICIWSVTPFALAGEAKLETDDQKTIYALGHLLAGNVSTYALDERELEILSLGLTDGALGRKPKVPLETYNAKIRALGQARMTRLAATEKEAGTAFLEKMATEKGAIKTDSGLIIMEIKAGTGESPSPKDTVKVHYHGALRDGTVFDSSVERGSPATFPLNRVIPCWTEGLQRMRVGGKSKLVCPSQIAYGDRGSPPKIKPGATLLFEVDLLEIVKPTPGGQP